MIARKLTEVSIAVAVALPGLALHEGKENEPYRDIVGVETVCYGETQGIEQRHYTDSECLIMLATRVSKDYEAPIANCVGNWVNYPLEARVASISLAYNIGVSAYCGSSIARNLREGNLEAACDSFLLWNKGRVNGRLREISGLTKRRQEERNFCMEGVVVAA